MSMARPTLVGKSGGLPGISDSDLLQGLVSDLWQAGQPRGRAASDEAAADSKPASSAADVEATPPSPLPLAGSDPAPLSFLSAEADEPPVVRAVTTLTTGPDIWVGTSGADTVDALDGDDTLTALSGNDTLAAFSGADTIFGGEGDDWIIAGEDADYAAGGGGNDTIFGGDVNFSDDPNAPDTLLGNTGNDTLFGRGGGDSLYGGGGADFIAAEEGDDSVYGGGGGDTITAGAGNDTLEGGIGADTIIGGVGIDFAAYVGSAAGVTVNIDDLATEIGGDAQDDTIINVFHLIGSQFDDTLIGNGSNEIVSPSPGNNSLVGLDGNDSLLGLTGLDHLQGGSGDDWLEGGHGADTIIGGDVAFDSGGNDTAVYLSSDAGVTVRLFDNATESGGHAEGDFLTQIDNLIGSAFVDTLAGTVGFNTLVGGDGDDTLDGRQGADTLIGGTGSDWAWYLASGNPVTVDLSDGMAESGGMAGGDVLTGIENIAGSNLNDTITGDAGTNTLLGNAGDDLLASQGGGDLLDGGDGNDTVDYRASLAGVTVDLTVGLGSGGLAEGDRYTRVENLLGSALADQLSGGAGTNTLVGFDGADLLSGRQANDTLLAGSGGDTLDGSLGADLLDGGEGNDVAIYVGASNFVYVDLAIGLGFNDEAEGDILVGVENLIGGAGNDTLVGDGGVNYLRGQTGNDSLQGGTGADSLFGELGNDVIFFDAADAAVIGGAGRDTLVGSSGIDAVQMNHGRFLFAGQHAAFEVVSLGDGNDFYNGSSNPAAFSQILGAGITVFGGSGNDAINMRGNGVEAGVSDYVDGGDGNDNIWGGGGNDTILGGNGNDNGYGGFGNDTFFGGAGFDVFYVGRDEGADRVVDSEGLVLFWGNEPIGGFYDGVDPTEISVAYGVTDVTITFLGDGSSVTFAKGAVEIINLFDFGNGDAGNGGAPPPAFARDIYSATWDSGSQTFTAFTLAVDG
jgi:Ca2+-binding RTX toxin-like protein